MAVLSDRYMFQNTAAKLLTYGVMIRIGVRIGVRVGWRVVQVRLALGLGLEVRVDDKPSRDRT